MTVLPALTVAISKIIATVETKDTVVTVVAVVAVLAVVPVFKGVSYSSCNSDQVCANPN